MKRISTLIIGLTLVAAVGLHAQAKRRAPMTRTQPMSHATNSAKSTTPSTAAPKSNSDSFKGIAAKLGTTPDALQTAYEAAKQANPKLSRGNFVAANMVAHNLGTKNPAITTQALSRVVGGGVSHRLRGSLALTLDGSVGLTAGSPKWVLSLGLGSVFAGTSPVGLSAPLHQLKSGFTGGVNRSGGSGKIGCR